MELKAAIEGLLLLSCNLYINVYTDSMYLKNGITNWIFDWEKTNWKNQKNCTIKNVDMWIILFGILKNKKRVNWMWIKVIIIV
jgi:ribonuclease HI